MMLSAWPQKQFMIPEQQNVQLHLNPAHVKDLRNLILRERRGACTRRCTLWPTLWHLWVFSCHGFSQPPAETFKASSIQHSGCLCQRLFQLSSGYVSSHQPLMADQIQPWSQSHHGHHGFLSQADGDKVWRDQVRHLWFITSSLLGPRCCARSQCGILFRKNLTFPSMGRRKTVTA